MLGLQESSVASVSVCTWQHIKDRTYKITTYPSPADNNHFCSCSFTIPYYTTHIVFTITHFHYQPFTTSKHMLLNIMLMQQCLMQFYYTVVQKTIPILLNITRTFFTINQSSQFFGHTHYKFSAAIVPKIIKLNNKRV